MVSANQGLPLAVLVSVSPSMIVKHDCGIACSEVLKTKVVSARAPSLKICHCRCPSVCRESRM